MKLSEPLRYRRVPIYASPRRSRRASINAWLVANTSRLAACACCRACRWLWPENDSVEYSRVLFWRWLVDMSASRRSMAAPPLPWPAIR
ncbi:hypothetical protein D3C71_2088480 [compost metagenome]